MRKRTLLLCVLALGIAWFGVGADGEAPVAEGAEPAPAFVLPGLDPGMSSLESSEECVVESVFAVDETSMSEAAGRKCKKCRGRKWCECTYQGKPRISCDPCCYQGPFDPLPVCLD